MKKADFLTALLLTTAANPAQKTALDAWAEQWGTQLFQQGSALFSGAFSFTEIGQFAQSAVEAAQGLKGIFSGQERAKIAQTILHTVIAEYAPLVVKEWALPLVDGPGCAALIEAAFQRIYGSGQQEVSAVPVVDAPDVTKGGVQ